MLSEAVAPECVCVRLNIMGGYYYLGGFLGLAAALVIIHSVGAKRRATVPLAVWWLCMGLGLVACGYAMFNSTGPSFAPRVTMTGRAFDCVEHRVGKESIFHFSIFV